MFSFLFTNRFEERPTFVHVPELAETSACVKERPSFMHAGSPHSIPGTNGK